MRIVYEDNLKESQDNSEVKYKFEIGKVYYGQFPSGAPARFAVIKRSDKFVTVTMGNRPEKKRYKIDLSWNKEAETFFVNSSGVSVSAENTFKSQQDFIKWAKENGAMYDI